LGAFLGSRIISDGMLMRAAETLPQLIAEEVGGMQLQQKRCQSSFLILACSCGGGAATAHC